MKKTIDACNGCGIHCVHCGRQHLEVRVCDRCGASNDNLHLFDAVSTIQELCDDCVAKAVKENFEELDFCSQTRVLDGRIQFGDVCCNCDTSNQLMARIGDDFFCEDCIAIVLDDLDTSELIELNKQL